MTQAGAVQGLFHGAVLEAQYMEPTCAVDMKDDLAIIMPIGQSNVGRKFWVKALSNRRLNAFETKCMLDDAGQVISANEALLDCAQRTRRRAQLGKWLRRFILRRARWRWTRPIKAALCRFGRFARDRVF